MAKKGKEKDRRQSAMVDSGQYKHTEEIDIWLMSVKDYYSDKDRDALW